jgi:hypothetical protein
MELKLITRLSFLLTANNENLVSSRIPRAIFGVAKNSVS